jgi:hypothetical protein
MGGGADFLWELRFAVAGITSAENAFDTLSLLLMVASSSTSMSEFRT